MKNKEIKNIICVLLCAVMLMSFISGCSVSDILGKKDSGTESSDSTSENTGDTSAKDEPAPAAEPVYDSDFTLNCSGGGSYNPFTYSDTADKDVSSLIYDSFFILDNSFGASSNICESFNTKDGVTYDFTLVQGIKMHDGSELDASDVVYSINEARVNSRYSKRLAAIENCSSTGDYTLRIKLGYTDYRLTSLLDIPIVSYGSAGDTNPAGSGPYMLSGSGDCLVPFDGYWKTDYVPRDRIELSTFSEENASAAFLGHTLDLVHGNSTAIDDLNIRVDCARGYIETSTLQYIGFNTENQFLASQKLRQAIYNAADRDYISGKIMNSGAVSAPLILSPALSCYDEAWESGKTYSEETVQKLFKDLKLKDTNNDGYLEYPVDGQYTDIELSFIINKDNPYKVRAARCITDELNSLGLHVELSELSWEEFCYSLATGNFDMYYGEARLTADFDVSPFFSENGSLNYGSGTDDSLVSLASAFIAAPEAAQAAKAQALCDAVYNKSLIVPVVYGRESVMTHWDTLTDMVYSQSGIFCNVSNSAFMDIK